MPSPANPRLVGDPVDTLTGAVVDHMQDFRLTGPLELRWARYYDSGEAHRSLSVGRGCAHEYDRCLVRDDTGLLYEEPIRRTLRFPLLGVDGDTWAQNGLQVTRLAVDRYRLSGHGEPAMEFAFPPGGQRARLTRLLQDEAEVRFRYDADQRLVGIDDSAGRRLVAEEDARGRLLRLAIAPTLTTPERLLIAYRYDPHGCLIATEDAKGRGYAFAYDAAHRMVQRRCLTGFAFDYAYDDQGRCVSAQGEDGLFGVALDYAMPRRFTRVTRPDGGVWGYLFSPKGDLEEVRDPLGGVQRYLRDADGRRTGEVDAAGNETAIEYDEAGTPIARIDPHGWRIPLPEDPRVAHPLDHRVADNPAEYEYGRALDVRALRIPGRAEIADLQLTPEVVGLISLKPETPPEGAKDAPPAPALEAAPQGYPWWPAPETGRVFDDLGYLREQCDPAGRQRQWAYDVAGNVREFTDFDGARWAYDWGRWHFLLGATNPLGAQVRYTYDPYGQVTSCTDAGGTRSEYRYDCNERLVEVRRHGVVRETYVRDVAGNLIVKFAGDGRLLLAQKIGPGNQPVQRSLGTSDLHDLDYDEAGRLIGGRTNRHRFEMAYDDLGNRTLELRDGVGVSLEFADWGEPATQVFFARFAFSWAREDDGSPNGVRVLTDPGGVQHRLRIGADGIVQRWLGNGSSEVAQYDELGRCLFKRARLGGGRDWTRRYHWSGEGELRRVDDSLLGVIEHAYDAAHRLTGRRIGDQVEVYRLDAADNLIEAPGLEGVELMAGNRLAAANGERFTYNDRNHVAEREGPAGRIVYRYDNFDQLVAITRPEGEWEAEYDILGRRVCKRWLGRTTEFYWYGDQLAAEIGPDGGVRIYVYADPLALSPFMMFDYESVEAEAAACRRYYLYADQLGTPCVIEDDERKVRWWERVWPYGLVEARAHEGVRLNLRWPGHYFDSEIGLHYNRFRYYDPGVGRYLESDPLGIAGGVNLYGYLGNPLTGVDVRGLAAISATSGVCTPASTRIAAARTPGEVIRSLELSDEDIVKKTTAEPLVRDLFALEASAKDCDEESAQRITGLYNEYVALTTAIKSKTKLISDLYPVMKKIRDCLPRLPDEILVGTEFTFTAECLHPLDIRIADIQKSIRTGTAKAKEKGEASDKTKALETARDLIAKWADLVRANMKECSSQQKPLITDKGHSSGRKATQAAESSGAERSGGKAGILSDLELQIFEVRDKTQPEDERKGWAKKFVYTDSFGNDYWWWQLDVDDSCLETQTEKSSLARLAGDARLRAIIQEHIFGIANKLGLAPDKVIGGGHISLDAQTLLGVDCGNVLLLKLFKTIETKASEWQGFFKDSDQENAAFFFEMVSPTTENVSKGYLSFLESLEGRKLSREQIAKSLKEFLDNNSCESSRLNQRSDDYMELKKRIRGYREHYLAVNFEHLAEPGGKARLEFRRIRAQTNLDELLQQIAFIMKLVEFSRGQYY